ncbi:MAG: MBL fold metallo-hydrolase [Bacteroidota bacterium]
MQIQYRTPQLTVFESALYRTTSTVFANEDLILVVDPNWLPDEVLSIRQYVDQIRAGQPLYLLFTHSDYDHILGYDLFRDAKVIASKAFAKNPAKAQEVSQVLAFDDKHYIHRPYTVEYPSVDITIASDGEKIEVGGTTLSFQLAPGHNPDGLIAYIEPASIWIVGDYLSNVEFPFIYYQTTAYIQTLQKARYHLQHKQPRVLISGHGDIALDRQEMERRIQESLLYIEELVAAAKGKRTFDLAPWLARYPFPKGLVASHEANLELAKLEQNP